MIFQHTWQLILAGQKTQTRRIVKGDTSPWVVGKSYAVQPGRAKKSVGRIAVTGVRQQRVGEISAADAKAEGFDSQQEFFDTWRTIHGELDLDQPVWVVEFIVVAT